MKKQFKWLLILSALIAAPWLFAQASRFLINRGYLQTNMDGGGNSITNLFSVAVTNRVDFKELTTVPGTPASGIGALYEKTDGKLYFKDDAGNEYDLTSSGGTPGGSTTTVQFNDAGAFNGDTNFVFNKTQNSLSIGNEITGLPTGFLGVELTSGGTGSGGVGSIYMQGRNSTASSSPFFLFERSRGTPASPSAVQNGDELFEIGSYTHGTSDFQEVLTIRGIIDGVPSGNLIPTRLRFEVKEASGSSRLFQMVGTNHSIVFGNQQNTFPLIKRSDEHLFVRLGDDSGDTDLRAKFFQQAEQTPPSIPSSGYLTTFAGTNGTLSLVNDDGQVHVVSTAPFTMTADATFSNVATTNSLFGTGVGSRTIKANSLSAGRTIRVNVKGRFSTDLISAGNVNVFVNIGGTNVLTTGLVPLDDATSAESFEIDAFITCRSTGASGTLMAQGGVEYISASSGNLMKWKMVNTTTTSFNTTSDGDVDVKWAFDTADTDNTVTAVIGTVELLN